MDWYIDAGMVGSFANSAKGTGQLQNAQYTSYPICPKAEWSYPYFGCPKVLSHPAPPSLTDGVAEIWTCRLGTLTQNDSIYYTLEYQSCLCAGAFPHRVVVSQTNACQWNASFSDRSVSSRQMQLQSEYCRHCSKLNLFSVDAVGQDNGCHFYQTHSGRTANSDDIWIPGHQQVGRVKYFNVFDGQKQHSDLVRWLQTCVSQFESRNHSGALPDRSCIICQLKTKGIGQSGNFSVKNVELSVVEQFF